MRDDLSCTLFFRTERIPSVLTVNSERGNKSKGFQFWVFPLLQDLLSAGCLTAHPEGRNESEGLEAQRELCGRAADIACKKGGNHRVNYPAADDRNQVVLPCNESSTRK